MFRHMGQTDKSKLSTYSVGIVQGTGQQIVYPNDPGHPTYLVSKYERPSMRYLQIGVSAGVLMVHLGEMEVGKWETADEDEIYPMYEFVVAFESGPLLPVGRSVAGYPRGHAEHRLKQIQEQIERSGDITDEERQQQMSDDDSQDESEAQEISQEADLDLMQVQAAMQPTSPETTHQPTDPFIPSYSDEYLRPESQADES